MATNIDEITQSISPISQAGHRGVDARTLFVTKQEAFQDDLTDTFVGEINILKDQQNTAIGQMNTLASELDDIKDTVVAKEALISPHYDNIDINATNITAINTNADNISFIQSAKTNADLAKESAEISLAVANFKGEWVNLSGGAIVPYSCYHNSKFWALLTNIPNVSSQEPNINSNYWAEIQMVAITRTPIIISPINGATNVDPQPTLEADDYRNIYNFSRLERQFEVALASNDFSSPVYTFAGDTNTHTLTSILDFNETYKWRCRDVPTNGEAGSWSSTTTFTTGETTIVTPTLTVSGEPNDISTTPTLTTSAFTVTGGIDTHLNTDWQILDSQLDVVWESLADAVNKESITVPSGYLSTDTEYTFRVRHRGVTFGASAWKTVTYTTRAVTVATPTVTVTGTPIDIPETPTITTSAFIVIGGADTHQSTDWQVIDNDTSTVVWESLADGVNLLSINVPSGILEVSKTYTFKARHRGVIYGVSSYGEETGTTKSQFTIPMTPAGSQGYGVAPCTEDFSLRGLTELTGTNDITSAQYGNYLQVSTGAIMVYVPKFFYRVGHTSSPNYATYGANAVDTVGIDTFSNEAEANASGYKMPRAFKDGGIEKGGVFVDKYINSQMASDSNKCTSVFGGIPISLSTNTSYTRSNTMTDCTGIFADAVTLARARGVGYACNTSFVWGMVALLQVAHAQASTSDTYCAWYDATDTTNYPKGCNDNALGDTDDATVAYEGSGEASKPKCGATANFAKTTHNGQECGIADLNGSMYEVVLGISNYGTSATSTTSISSNNLYVLKDSVSVADLTGGWNSNNGAWGNDAHMQTLYDSFISPATISSAISEKWGNSTNGVFVDDERIVGFIPKNDSATSASGTNQFGIDQCYKRNIQNMMPLCGGFWGDASAAGVFTRNFSNARSSSSHASGFRCLAYL